MFVVLHPLTKDNSIIVGKNSVRPIGEVQEVIHFPAVDHDKGSLLQCTYMTIEQVAHTNALVLSSPSWMWGGEMGANEKGITVATVAVWTKLNSSLDLEKRLLGADLVRLALERASSCKAAVDVITDLIQEHGQGGSCSEASGLTGWAHHNSFIIADGSDAWVLETAGALWVAKHISDPVVYINNELIITTDMDLKSPGLEDKMRDLSLYDGSETFNFSKLLSLPRGESSLISDEKKGLICLESLLGNAGVISALDMFEVLRQEGENTLAVGAAFEVASSLVSTLFPIGTPTPNHHWLTATPNPCASLFKPIVFTVGMNIGEDTKSPDFGSGDPAPSEQGSEKEVDRRHPLYLAHEKFRQLLDDADKGHTTVENFRGLEKNCYHDICEIVENFTDRNAAGVSEIFKHMCELEVNFYKF